jgi:exodeoxyribonuclease V alpha subunit
MQHLEELSGIVDHIIFQNEENGFTIFVVQTSRTQKITIKGHTVGLHAGQQIVMHGSWITHPKFGKQFEATRCAISLPT